VQLNLDLDDFLSRQLGAVSLIGRALSSD
jgi:hypothetical protein